MTRTSIHIDGLSHRNPIPAASRAGNVIVSGITGGVDPATGELPESVDAQCARMLQHVRAIVEAGGGGVGDIVKFTVYLADHASRDALNRGWLAMFPDSADRPARQAMPGTPSRERLIECDFVAVVAR